MRKIILFVLIMCFMVFADTGDWDISSSFVSSFRGTITSFVHTGGMFIVSHEHNSSYAPDCLPDGELRVRIYDFDGTLLKSTQLISASDGDLVGTYAIHGNSNYVWVAWEQYNETTDKHELKLRKINYSGGSWGSWGSANTYVLDAEPDEGDNSARAKYAIKIHADDDKVHIVAKYTDQGRKAYYFSQASGSSTLTSYYLGEYTYVHHDYNIDVCSRLNYSGSSDIIQCAFVGLKTNDPEVIYHTRSPRYITSWNYTASLEEYTHPVRPIELMIEMDDSCTYVIGTESAGTYYDTLDYTWQPIGGSVGWFDHGGDTLGLTPQMYTQFKQERANYGTFDAASKSSDGVFFIINYEGITEFGLWFANLRGDKFVSYESVVDDMGGNDDMMLISDLSINADDFYIPYTTSYISGTTWYTGDIKFTVKDYAPLSPSLNKSWQGSYPKITWEQPCFDAEEYKVYRKIIPGGSYTLIATTSNLYYVDSDFGNPPPGSNKLYYKVKTVDYDNNLSGYSNEIVYKNMRDLREPEKAIGEISPTEYALHDAYPNPFNPITTITFDLPEDNFVNISIYNSMGKKVTTLVNGNMKKGRHQTQFNGDGFSSGIYFLQMVTNEFKNAQKIILTK